MTTNSKTFASEVWEKLSAVDVSDQTQVIKAGSRELTYLSWSWAWSILMEHYPESKFEFEEPRVLNDNTVEVWCVISVIDGDRICKRKMWLPVMDSRNNSLENPSSRQISDARMRCLVKTLSLFGLGIHLYANSDIPVHEVQVRKEFINSEQVDTLNHMLQALEASESDIQKFCNAFNCTALENMKRGEYSEAVNALVRKAKQTVSGAQK